MRSRTDHFLLLLAALLVASAALYSRTTGFEFIEYDDSQRIVSNERVTAGLTRDGFVWAWTTTAHAPYWHPLTWLSHMLDCEIHGLNAGGHHLTNLVLHLLNVSLLAILLRRLTGRNGRSVFAAGLFAVHPIQVGTVAWVSARPDLLATGFGLLSLVAYASFARDRGPGARALSLAALALALLSKPSVAALPVLMLLLDYWPLERITPAKGWRSIRPAVLEKWPWFAVALAGASTVFLDAERVGGLAPESSVAAPLRIANAAVSYVRYLARLVAPRDLSVHYPHPDLPGGDPWAAWQIAGSFALILALTVWALRPGRRRYVAAGWLWFLVALFPVSGVLQVGDQAMADRYAYLPLIGLFVAVSWGGRDLLVGTAGRRGREVAAMVTGVVLLAVLGVASWFHLEPWRDSESLFRQALKAYPSDPVMRYNLGVVLEREDRLEEAEGQYRAALEVRPDRADSHNNLGTVLFRRGRPEEALVHYTRALEIRPRHLLARNNFANTLRSLGRVEDAIDRYRSLLEDRPAFVAARRNLAAALRDQGRSEEAAEQYREILRRDPADAEAAHDLGIVLLGTDGPEAAREPLESAVRLRPDWPEALADLALILAVDGTGATAEQRRRAVTLAERAAALAGENDPRIQGILARAYLATGDPGKARMAAERGLRLAEDRDPGSPLAASLRSLLEGIP